MAKMKGRKVAGRPKSYTAKEFEKVVNRYFASISRERELTEQIFDGTDEDGNEIYKTVPVLNNLGEPVVTTEYFKKPTQAGLCKFARIHRDTFNAYARDPEYKDICAAAMLECEAFLWERLGSGKGDTGIQFELTNNYGAKNRLEIEAGEDTRRSIEGVPRTTDEKIRFLLEHGYTIPGLEEGKSDADEDT